MMKSMKKNMRSSKVQMKSTSMKKNMKSSSSSSSMSMKSVQTGVMSMKSDSGSTMRNMKSKPSFVIGEKVIQNGLSDNFGSSNVNLNVEKDSSTKENSNFNVICRPGIGQGNISSSELDLLLDKSCPRDIVHLLREQRLDSILGLRQTRNFSDIQLYQNMSISEEALLRDLFQRASELSSERREFIELSQDLSNTRNLLGQRYFADIELRSVAAIKRNISKGLCTKVSLKSCMSNSSANDVDINLQAPRVLFCIGLLVLSELDDFSREVQSLRASQFSHQVIKLALEQIVAEYVCDTRPTSDFMTYFRSCCLLKCQVQVRSMSSNSNQLFSSGKQQHAVGQAIINGTQFQPQFQNFSFKGKGPVPFYQFPREDILGLKGKKKGQVK